MKKHDVGAAIALLVSISGPARADDYYPVDVGILPALSISAAGGEETRTNFALGLVMAGNDRVDGLSLATAVSGVDHTLRGAQIAGAVSYASIARGVQLAGGVNVATKQLTGVQIAPVNYADQAAGVQVGTVNVGGDVSGLQIGVVNLSRTMRGPSLGLINYSTEGGILKPTFFSSDVSLAATGLRVGTSWGVYSLFAISTGMAWNTGAWAGGIGLGKRLDVSADWYVDVDDLVWWAFPDKEKVDSDRQSFINSVRLLAGYRVADLFAVHAGPTFNVLVKRADGAKLAPDYAWSAGDDVNLWFGAALGVEVF